MRKRPIFAQGKAASSFGRGRPSIAPIAIANALQRLDGCRRGGAAHNADIDAEIADAEPDAIAGRGVLERGGET